MKERRWTRRTKRKEIVTILVQRKCSSEISTNDIDNYLNVMYPNNFDPLRRSFFGFRSPPRRPPQIIFGIDNDLRIEDPFERDNIRDLVYALNNFYYQILSNIPFMNVMHPGNFVPFDGYFVGSPSPPSRFPLEIYNDITAEDPFEQGFVLDLLQALNNFHNHISTNIPIMNAVHLCGLGPLSGYFLGSRSPLGITSQAAVGVNNLNLENHLVEEQYVQDLINALNNFCYQISTNVPIMDIIHVDEPLGGIFLGSLLPPSLSPQTTSGIDNVIVEETSQEENIQNIGNPLDTFHNHISINVPIMNTIHICALEPLSGYFLRSRSPPSSPPESAFGYNNYHILEDLFQEENFQDLADPVDNFHYHVSTYAPAMNAIHICGIEPVNEYFLRSRSPPSPPPQPAFGNNNGHNLDDQIQEDNILDLANPVDNIPNHNSTNAPIVNAIHICGLEPINGYYLGSRPLPSPPPQAAFEYNGDHILEDTNQEENIEGLANAADNFHNYTSTNAPVVNAIHICGLEPVNGYYLGPRSLPSPPPQAAFGNNSDHILDVPILEENIQGLANPVDNSHNQTSTNAPIMNAIEIQEDEPVSGHFLESRSPPSPPSQGAFGNNNDHILEDLIQEQYIQDLANPHDNFHNDNSTNAPNMNAIQIREVVPLGGPFLGSRSRRRPPPQAVFENNYDHIVDDPIQEENIQDLANPVHNFFPQISINVPYLNLMRLNEYQSFNRYFLGSQPPSIPPPQIAYGINNDLDIDDPFEDEYYQDPVDARDNIYYQIPAYVPLFNVMHPRYFDPFGGYFLGHRVPGNPRPALGLILVVQGPEDPVEEQNMRDLINALNNIQENVFNPENSPDRRPDPTLKNGYIHKRP